MAEHLASIFGTEKDRVNCPFYFKIGACRHGDRCSRLHNRPTISPTLLLSNMYQRPDMITPGVDAQGQPIDPRKIQEHFEDFYEDIFEELSKFGEIESLNVCDNLADHMIGNVYVQFREEDQAAAALQALQGRFYSGRPIIADFSPVTDFREATCRQYEENSCNRGGYCNFMHVKVIGRELRRKLFGRHRRYRGSRSRSRSASPRHRREREYREKSRDRDRDDHLYILMGNSVAPCFQPNQSSRSSSSSSVKLIFWEGNTRTLTGKRIAGEVMFEFPDMMVCHADSFFIGHPIPALSMDDRLMPGQTYFVLPLDRFACKVLSASSLAALNSKSSPKPTPINFGACPFEHVKGANGRVLIKVVPEFITSLIVKSKEEDSEIGSSGNSFLCSTPELKKHYQNLVGSKQQEWSPKLETISEYKIRFSPCRFIGLEWKQRENQF